MSGSARVPGSRPPALPSRPLGWLALVLLVTVIAVPAWWGSLQNVIGSGVVMVLVAVVVGVAAFGLGGAAVLSRRDDAVVLRVALAAAVVVTFAALLVLVGFAWGGG